MSRKCLPSLMEAYLDYTQFQESPAKFHMWCCLYMIASVVKRNVFMDKFYYQLYPNLYIALVGPSAQVKKTTSAEIVIPLIQTIPDIFLIKGKMTAWEFFHSLGAASAKSGDASASIYSPEAKHLFGELGKIELVTMLTDLYGSPDHFTYRTLKHGVIDLKNICINLLLCSTPEWLITGTTIDEIAGGWTGRFVYIFEESCDRSFAFPEDYITPRIADVKQDILDDLKEIAQCKGEFVITPDAKAAYTYWYNARKGEWKDERLMGYYGRKADMVWKVSMLISLSRDNSLVVDDECLKTAWIMLKDIEKNMGKALSMVVEDPGLRFKDMVLGYIINCPGHRATRTEILKKFWNRIDSDVLDKVIRNCMEARVVKMYPVNVKGDQCIMYEITDSSTNC